MESKSGLNPNNEKESVQAEIKRKGVFVGQTRPFHIQNSPHGLDIFNGEEIKIIEIDSTNGDITFDFLDPNIKDLMEKELHMKYEAKLYRYIAGIKKLFNEEQVYKKTDFKGREERPPSLAINIEALSNILRQAQETKEKIKHTEKEKQNKPLVKEEIHDGVTSYKVNIPGVDEIIVYSSRSISELTGVDVGVANENKDSGVEISERELSNLIYKTKRIKTTNPKGFMAWLKDRHISWRIENGYFII